MKVFITLSMLSWGTVCKLAHVFTTMQIPNQISVADCTAASNIYIYIMIMHAGIDAGSYISVKVFVDINCLGNNIIQPHSYIDLII